MGKGKKKQKVTTIKLSPTQSEYCMSEDVVNVLVSNTGEGKCLNPLGKLIYFDGSAVYAKDVRVGDLLMGDDSTPRRVLSITRGSGEMYRVVPLKGESFECNGDHILVLKRTNTTKSPSLNGNIVELSVDDYIKQTPTFKHLHKLYRVGVEFNEKEVLIDPYFLGIWLGDGTATVPSVTTQDDEVVDYLEKFAIKHGLRLVVSKDPKRCLSYRLSGNGGNSNIVLDFLREHDLINNKHIPMIYKTNNRFMRIRLLAGLIDADGWTNNSGYQLIFKSERLAQDIVFLCRSLGFAAYLKPRIKKGFGITGTYYHIMISGDCSLIPVKVAHKKVAPRRQIKDVLVTGIREVVPLGVGDYYGFTLDGNHRFLLGDFTVSHNTYASIVAMFVHAQRCGRPIRCAIVRDTHENIKNSTAQSIKEDFGDLCRFSNDSKKCVFYTTPRVTVDLFGISEEGALGKLQGNEYALIWLEEPAPMSSKSNAGLSEGVFNAALVRSVRQKLPPYCRGCGHVPDGGSEWLGEVDEEKRKRVCSECGEGYYWPHGRLQVSMNPADEEHWTFKRLIEVDLVDPENPLITKQVWFVRYGENIHVSEVSRQAVKAAYKDDPASYMRYVMGQFAPVYQGKSVTPEYNSAIHLSENALEPAYGLVSFCICDGWHNPSAVLGQITRTGRLIILDVMRMDGGDIRSLLDNQVGPLLESPRWKGKARAWRVGGDTTMVQPDQSNKQESAAKVVVDFFQPYGARVFEQGPSTWSIIKMGLKNGLNRMIEGMPAVFINADCRLLHKGLSGGWFYKTDNAGNIIGVLPEKNEVSHVCDALANAINIFLPTRLFHVDPKRKRELEMKMKSRASSYVTPQ